MKSIASIVLLIFLFVGMNMSAQKKNTYHGKTKTTQTAKKKPIVKKTKICNICYGVGFTECSWCNDGVQTCKNHNGYLWDRDECNHNSNEAGMDLDCEQICTNCGTTHGTSKCTYCDYGRNKPQCYLCKGTGKI